MASTVDEQYMTHDGRLASFQKTKKRGSTAKGAKALNWPHKSIAPESLAQAGFYFQPHIDNPDNCICFLCQKSMDGWEEGDNPVLEHLKHSPNCGWAITAAIEIEVAEYVLEDPGHPQMIEARRATFGDRWPHEGKKGWKCKTKQLVDAGWKYTPTPDSDDMATCAYCQLALDGWEPADKPLDEHYNRSSSCPFFSRVHESQSTNKKGSRTKNSRASKASRLSTQSITAASDAPSIIDSTAAFDDTVMTTASTMTQGGKKPRAKKATTAKGKRTKAKKEEPEEELPAQTGLPEEDPVSPEVAPKKAKATRGKKRGSEAVDESTMTASEAPTTKRRNTRTRGSAAVDSSVMDPSEDERSLVPTSKKAPSKAKKGRASNTKPARKASATSNASFASIRGIPGDFPDDDEIERQLEADLERFSDEDDIMADSDSERTQARLKASRDKSMTLVEEVATRKSDNFSMFDPAPVEPDDVAVEEELAIIRTEMEARQPTPGPVEEPMSEPEPLQITKKSRQAGPRKVSKQVKSKKAKIASPSPEDEEEELVAPEPRQEEAIQAELREELDDEVQEDGYASQGSTDTVVKKTVTSTRSSLGKRGRGRPPKTSLASNTSVELVEVSEVLEESEQAPKKRRGRPSKSSTQEPMEVAEEVVETKRLSEVRRPGRPSKASLAPQELPEESEPARNIDEEDPSSVEPPKKRGRGRPSKTSLAPTIDIVVAEDKLADPPAKRGRGRPPKKSLEARVSLEAARLSGESAQDEILVDTQEVAPKEPTPSPLRPTQEALHPPSTPAHVVSPAPSAAQPVLSPSPSPQSSDAENQPPSSKPAASAKIKRVVLAPVPPTPMRGSPSKRNIMAGLQTTTPWNAVDLDGMLGTPRVSADKENGVERLLRMGKNLTSPEKGMTVEEWVYHNAGQAEKMLKHECEAMVSRFESEGTKAMNALEGLIVE